MRSTRGRELAPWVNPPSKLVSAARAEAHVRNAESAMHFVRERSSYQLRECFIDDPPASDQPRSRSQMLAQRRAWTLQQNLQFQDRVRSSMPRGRTLGAPGRNPNVKNFNHLETATGRDWFWGPHPHLQNKPAPI